MAMEIELGFKSKKTKIFFKKCMRNNGFFLK